MHSNNRLQPVCVIFFSLLCFLPEAAFTQQTSWWGDLEEGTYAVGYTVIHQLDRSRVWEIQPDSLRSGEPGRPIRISVWYPAVIPHSQSPMTFEDYVRDNGPTERFHRLTEILEEKLRWIFSDAAPQLYDTLLTLPLAAYLDAQAVEDSFPTILYSSGGTAAVPDNGSLAAFLASHGYVVAAVPQLGSVSPLEIHRSLNDRVETQARDSEFAMAAISALPYTDTKKIAVVGYSFGGSVAMRIAGRNPNVDAVVGLDASFVSGGQSEMDIKSFRIPLLSLYAAEESSWSEASHGFVDSLHFSERYLGSLHGLVHGDFSELRGMLIPALIPEALNEDELALAHVGYQTLCRYVLSFLDAALKDQGAGFAFIRRSSEENGLTPGLLTTHHVPSVDIPTEEEFVALLDREGFDSARQVLEEAERDYPYIDIIDHGLFYQFGYRLLEQNRTRHAVAVFRLNATAHPNSAYALNSLAEGYLAHGDTTDAIVTFERLLEILPSDDRIGDEAKERLRRRALLQLRVLRIP